MTTKVKAIARPKIRNSILEVLETKLKETLRSSADRQGLEVEYLADPADQVRSVVDRELVVKRLNQKAQLIQELRSAIARVRSEGFGICDECEEPIGEQRLHAIPWARLCVKCQNRSESAQKAIGFGNAA